MSRSLQDEESILLSNPGLKKLFNKMLDDRINQARKEGESSRSCLLTALTPNGLTDKGELVRNKQVNVVNRSNKDPLVKSLQIQLSMHQHLREGEQQ